ncbi:MAG TPA: laminin B domain-containing protein, partial [Polyangiaceae bacterium]|nr:laminin B domain-containing protein [Polyangiaceae bacterium]
GNPGGLITAKDDTTGGVFYFVAPAKYLGDASSTYGKTLTFDLKTTSVDSPFTAYGVMLSGGGVTVIALMPYDPSPAGQWKSYSFALDPSGGWKIVSGPDIHAEDSFTSAAAASESDLHKVLSGLSILRIRGEYNDGPDSGSLDNVKFGG